MKKAISMMLATAMAATCLAGCGSAASSSAASSSEAASSEATSAATSEASTGEKTFENNELNIAVFEGGYGSEYWDEIIKRFEAAYPGVTVNMQISPKIGDIIRPQIVAGNVPDFISMNDNDSTGLISSMVKEHALMDLSDVFEEGGIDDDTPLKDQVIDGLLDSAKCSPYGDGKIYIAPFSGIDGSDIRISNSHITSADAGGHIIKRLFSQIIYRSSDFYRFTQFNITIREKHIRYRTSLLQSNRKEYRFLNRIRRAIISLILRFQKQLIGLRGQSIHSLHRKCKL